MVYHTVSHICKYTSQCSKCLWSKCPLFDTVCSFPGETAMNHDYYTLEPTYVNHPAQDSSYAVLKGHVYATNPASEVYADVPDLVATATTSSNLDESQAYETPIPLGDHYECVTSHTLNSSYLFVPTMVSACATVQQCTVYVRT